MKISESVLRKIIREELEEMDVKGATLVWDPVKNTYVPSEMADFGRGDELARAAMAAREKDAGGAPLAPSQAELEAMDDKELPLDENLQWDHNLQTGFTLRMWKAGALSTRNPSLAKLAPAIVEKLQASLREGMPFSVVSDSYSMRGTERGALGSRVTVSPGKLMGGEESPRWAPQPAESVLVPGWFVESSSDPYMLNVPIAGRKL